VTHVLRPSAPLLPPPWPARRALDFCAELAGALAPLHEAGATHGALCPAAVEMRHDGGPLVQVPCGAGDAADDLHGLGLLLLYLLSARTDGAGVTVAGEVGSAADAAVLLQSLLATEPEARPASAREVAARLTEIAARVPDTTPAVRPAGRSRRRARLVAALFLLLIAGGAGAYVVDHRVGPPGPALSPGTVPVPPPVTT
jgi:hypothetical protein